MWSDLNMQDRSRWMKFFMENGVYDLDQMKQEYNEFSKGGSTGIHIKPSHRGRLTELKKRTGKTEAELYNDGNPAHKKMVVFARNARRWKHDNGGYLYDIIQDNLGLWKYPGYITDIKGDYNGTDITMNYVDYPVFGISDRGEKKLMMPYKDYHFNGLIVREFPVGHKALEGRKIVATPEQTDQARMRYNGYFNAMVNNGINPIYAKDAAYFATQLSFAESGWKPNKNHNYGGMKNSKGLISYPSDEAYFDAWVKNANNKWPEYFKSQSIEDWDEALNHTSLGLVDQKSFNAYQKKNPGTYIYAPAWENDSYLNKMRGVKTRMDGALGTYSNDLFMDHMKKQDPLNYRMGEYILEHPLIAQYQYGGLAKPFSYSYIPEVRYLRGGNIFQDANSRIETLFGKYGTKQQVNNQNQRIIDNEGKIVGWSSNNGLSIIQAPGSAYGKINWTELDLENTRMRAYNKMKNLKYPIVPQIQRSWQRKPRYGNSCIYTATSVFGNDFKSASNKEFAANPELYGFKLIEFKDMDRGDLYQHYDINGTPKHMVMFDSINPQGLYLFHYSRGSDNPDDSTAMMHYAPYLEIASKDDGLENWQIIEQARNQGKVYRFIGRPVFNYGLLREYDRNKFGR